MILAALLLLKLSTTTAATLLTLVAWLAPSSCADGQLETPDGLWCLQELYLLAAGLAGGACKMLGTAELALM